MGKRTEQGSYQSYHLGDQGAWQADSALFTGNAAWLLSALRAKIVHAFGRTVSMVIMAFSIAKHGAGPGALISQFRRRAGLTQREVADLAGLSVAGVRDVEQGRVASPRSGTLVRLAEALGLSARETDELLRSVSVVGERRDTRLEVLGSLQLVRGGEVVEIGSLNQRVLLAVLALAPNVPVGRDELVEALWGPQPPVRAVDMLQSRLSRLRQRLETSGDGHTGLALDAVAGGYRLSVDPDEHDLLSFRKLVEQARHYLASGNLLDASSSFGAAIALWRGEPVADVPGLSSHPVVAGLVNEWKGVAVEYAGLAAELGQYGEPIPALRNVIAVDPLYEPGYAALMTALAGSGQQAEALQIFGTLRHRLVDELGADPSQEVSDAHQRVLRHEVAQQKYVSIPAHKQLPPDIADFSGRETELDELRKSLPFSPDGRTALVISAIEGMGGVGKTRLAIHFAHQLLAEGHYADVQLYVDLLGHSEQPPADPAAVLVSFLRLLGVESNQIPQNIDERAALYRDRLYGKKALVLLDNATNEDQVSPLLPASPSNLVLITSRRTLAVDGANTLPLSVFTTAEADELLEHVLGSERVRGDPKGTRRLLELCGHLPLAVALVARRLRSRTAWSFDNLADRLEEARDRLSELAAGSRKLRAVLDLSYRALSPEAQRVFRLSGLHPGGDFTAEAIAALADVTPDRARSLLDHLVDEHLVTVVSHDRYRLHDLVAEYARSMVAAHETEEHTKAATMALLNYYLYTATDAGKVLQPQRPTPTFAWTPPQHPTPFRTWEQADTWLEAERANISAEISFAAAQGLPTYTWQLTMAVQGFLALRGFIEDWIQMQQKALSATQAAGDLYGEKVARTYLGGAYIYQGQTEKACDHLYRALEIHAEQGDQDFERVLNFSTLSFLGHACSRLGRFEEALHHVQQAAALVESTQPWRGGMARSIAGAALIALGRHDEALKSYQRVVEVVESIGIAESSRAIQLREQSPPLANLGEAYRRLGRFDDAVEYLERALVVAKENGLAPVIANARHHLGNVYRELKRYPEAIAELNEALRIVQTAGSVVAESEVLVDLGATYRDMGELEAATDVLQQAVTVANQKHERYPHARAHALLTQVYHTAGQESDAHHHNRLAEELFAELGVPNPI